jgi:transposase-like protein
MVEPLTRGDLVSSLRWICRSTRKLTEELNNRGHKVSHSTVAVLISDLGIAYKVIKKLLRVKATLMGMPNLNTLIT